MHESHLNLHNDDMEIKEYQKKKKKKKLEI